VAVRGLAPPALLPPPVSRRGQRNRIGGNTGHSTQHKASSTPRTELPAWEETMTDQEMLALLPRIAAVSEQTDASLQRLVTALRGRG
jgi:hypothetical protein